MGRLAMEFGRHGITVNAYAPGLIDTGMRQSFIKVHISPSSANNR